MEGSLLYTVLRPSANFILQILGCASLLLPNATMFIRVKKKSNAVLSPLLQGPTDNSYYTAKQIKQNKLSTDWIHSECAAHPVTSPLTGFLCSSSWASHKPLTPRDTPFTWPAALQPPSSWNLDIFQEMLLSLIENN